MGQFQFWQRWLAVTCVIVTAAGVGLALFGGTLLVGVLDPVFHRVFWGDQPLDATTRAYQGWVYGVLGGTLAGWGACLTLLAQGPFARRESSSWYAITAGLVVWFVLDTAISLTARVFANVILNALILAWLGLPLLMTWPVMKRGAER